MFLIKWLITGTLIYFLYRKFFALPAPRENTESENHITDHQDIKIRTDNQNDGEYIEYEEVE